jgi:hypothetical protein
MGFKVFILGSGFSASMGLPTLLGLFHEMMSFESEKTNYNKDNILYAIGFLYPHFNPKISPPSYPPFEEFLSLVTAAEDLPYFDEGHWESKKLATLELLTDTLASKSSEAEENDLLKEFVSNLEDQDVIITFNWDNLIERTLYSASRNINFLNRDSNAVTILKLHGSLNWGKLPKDVKLKHPDSVKYLSEKIVYTTDYTYYDTWLPLNTPPFIVPPIHTKQALSENFFKNIWHEAFNVIIEAEQVVFIGYSIPKEDLQARSLLSTSWIMRVKVKGNSGDKFILIDPNPEVCGRYSSVISNGVKYFQTRFNKDALALISSAEN